ncbi:hypothetical protein CRUP_022838, partial [Coryphaenoides rupestris]
PCTFETDQCQWNDSSQGPRRVLHGSGVDAGRATRRGVPLQPPPPRLVCLLFHFHMSGGLGAGSLAVLMQQAEGGGATLWSRSHNRAPRWTPDRLPLGQQHHPYKSCPTYLADHHLLNRKSPAAMRTPTARNRNMDHWEVPSRKLACWLLHLNTGFYFGGEMKEVAEAGLGEPPHGAMGAGPGEQRGLLAPRAVHVQGPHAFAVHGTQRESEADLSFFNNLYDGSPADPVMSTTNA